MTTIAICTIIAKNYLALAKTLGDSIRAFHPDLDFRTLVVDPFNPTIPPSEADKIILDSPADFIDEPLLNELAYNYEITEFNTAVKPFYLEHLLQQGYEKVIYLDPDILILRSLDEIFQSLDDANILLIPHLLDPIPLDNCLPSEITILQAGAYNLGFIGVSNRQETNRFLSWWKERLEIYCCIAPDRGLFVDQKWIDLVPGMFEKVCIFTKRGYNVAYWNLNARNISKDDETYWVDGEPLVFFHFSGFNPDFPDRLSKHQNRLTIEPSSSLSQLLLHYAALLEANHHHRYKQWSYGYGIFSNDVPLDDIGRHLLKGVKQLGKSFPNPLNVDAVPSFFAWLNSSVEGCNPSDSGTVITNYLYAFYQNRPDLQAAFPDVLNRHKDDYLNWTSQDGIRQGIHPAFVRASATIADNNNGNGGHPVAPTASFGVNVAGYLKAESGVGQAARGYVAVLKSCNCKLALLDFSDKTYSRQEDYTLSDFSTFNPYPINLLCINADQVVPFVRHVGVQFLEQKYNIGEWAWELPSFPTEWRENFEYFDEIWVGSKFIYEAASQYSPVPVITVPYVVRVNLDRAYSKTDFDLPEDEYTFLFSFDFLSIFPRKNPLALIAAFKEAFRPDEPVRLVLKCINGEYDLENYRILKDAIADSRITLCDRYLSRNEKNGLLSACDCYVSLHRSEGFGLSIAEAMYLEKPVIATGWSGSMDFMTVNNSYPVEYRLTEIERDYGPYKKGEIWAEPNIAHAAKMMRQVYEQPTEAKQKAKRAAVDIRATNSPETVAQIVQKRLELIENMSVEIKSAPMQPLLEELKRTQEKVAAMETSKFWRLRKRWFGLKRLVGLKTDNE